ncbi:hypothetical protein ABK040_006763 [Willaertia magna]
MPFTYARHVLNGLGSLYSSSSPTFQGFTLVFVSTCFAGTAVYKIGRRFYNKHLEQKEKDILLKEQKEAILKGVIPNYGKKPMINAPFIEQQAKRMIMQQQKNN